MAWKLSTILIITLLLFLFSLSHAQTPISTDTPVPPLQWINLSGLLKGTSQPPPLKDPVIGYDEISRSLIIFGGESASGLVQAQTYLLNLETLTWSIPSPPANLQHTPPARSAAIAGGDFAASNRHGFVVIGGKGADGKGLSDIWEYDFINQFWSQVEMSPGGPLPRWGASGGIDISTPFIQDPVVPGPNNTFYLLGGFDEAGPRPLSDVWRLNISGTLSSNLPNSSTGSWDHVTIGSLPAKMNQGGAVISQQVIIAGGCNATSSVNEFCAQQDSYVVDVQRQGSISPGACPIPRLGPVLAQNANRFSTSFASQVYLLLGNIDSSKWEDDGSLKKGEVAVLDIHTGLWSRVLPSGDPGISGKPTYPTPREGAASFSYNMALVGSQRNTSADTIVFGGRDPSGNTLSEVWLLRAYAGIITPSNLEWSGFGNGELQTGVDANGSGVRVQYMSKCATAIQATPSNSPSPSPSPSPLPSPSPTPGVSPSSFHHFDSSTAHKVLAPLSLATFQLVFLFSRATSQSNWRNHLPTYYAIYAAFFVAYALGIAGLVTSFTGISMTPQANSHSQTSSLHLRTGHGIAGLVLFACLYVLLPGLLIVSLCTKRLLNATIGVESNENRLDGPGSPNTVEKVNSASRPMATISQSTRDNSSLSSPRPRTNSWGPSSILHRSHEGRMSSDSESGSSISPRGGFEVTNRPARTRHVSGSSVPILSTERHPYQTTRSLGDVDWLQRRRSLNAVGELDYVITQAQRAQMMSTPATADALLDPTSQETARPQLLVPKPSKITIRLLIQASILGLSILTLIALWFRAPRFAFALFLAWTVIFYVTMFIFSWHLRPEDSILAIMFSRLRFSPPDNHISNPSTATTPIPHQPGPYVHHQPPFRTAVVSDDGSFAPRSIETDVDDDNIDEHTAQRIIEEEMGRREVSIITIPKRKLWVANPS